MKLNPSEFYLGQAYDLANKAAIPDKLIFYDPSDLTTHAVITGMTGSGKTGMGIILLSFNLFDRCLPEMSLKEGQIGPVSRMVYRPWVMFLLGAGVTMISMSVSVSLGILVPLSNRGFIRRENVIPYIMGANITTFVDTLLAAVLLNNPPAFTVVLTEMLSIAVVSLVILLLFYRRFEALSLRLVNAITRSGRNLALFMTVLFVVPIVLLLL